MKNEKINKLLLELNEIKTKYNELEKNFQKNQLEMLKKEKIIKSLKDELEKFRLKNETNNEYLINDEFINLWENFTKSSLLDSLDNISNNSILISKVSNILLKTVYDFTKEKIKNKIIDLNKILGKENLDFDNIQNFFNKFKTTIFQCNYKTILIYQNIENELNTLIRYEMKKNFDDENFNIIILDLNSKEFKRSLEQLFNISKYMLFHDPILNFKILNNLNYVYYNKNEYSVFEGFSKSSNNTVSLIILFPPQYKNLNFFKNLKPSVYCIENPTEEMIEQCEIEKFEKLKKIQSKSFCEIDNKNIINSNNKNYYNNSNIIVSDFIEENLSNNISNYLESNTEITLNTYSNKDNNNLKINIIKDKKINNVEKDNSIINNHNNNKEKNINNLKNKNNNNYIKRHNTNTKNLNVINKNERERSKSSTKPSKMFLDKYQQNIYDNNNNNNNNNEILKKININYTKELLDSSPIINNNIKNQKNKKIDYILKQVTKLNSSQKSLNNNINQKSKNKIHNNNNKNDKSAILNTNHTTINNNNNMQLNKSNSNSKIRLHDKSRNNSLFDYDSNRNSNPKEPPLTNDHYKRKINTEIINKNNNTPDFIRKKKSSENSYISECASIDMNAISNGVNYNNQYINNRQFNNNNFKNTFKNSNLNNEIKKLNLNSKNFDSNYENHPSYRKMNSKKILQRTNSNYKNENQHNISSNSMASNNSNRNNFLCNNGKNGKLEYKTSNNSVKNTTKNLLYHNTNHNFINANNNKNTFNNYNNNNNIINLEINPLPIKTEYTNISERDTLTSNTNRIINNNLKKNNNNNNLIFTTNDIKIINLQRKNEKKNKIKNYNLNYNKENNNYNNNIIKNNEIINSSNLNNNNNNKIINNNSDINTINKTKNNNINNNKNKNYNNNNMKSYSNNPYGNKFKKK